MKETHGEGCNSLRELKIAKENVEYNKMINEFKRLMNFAIIFAVFGFLTFTFLFIWSYLK